MGTVVNEQRQMKHGRGGLPRVAAMAMVLAAAAGPVSAQAPEIPFRMVAGVPCARCTVHFAGKSIAANVVLDIGMGGMLAWEAHLGGFVAGWLIASVVRPRLRRRAW